MREICLRFGKHLSSVREGNLNSPGWKYFTEMDYKPKNLAVILHIKGGNLECKIFGREFIYKYNLVQKGMNRNLLNKVVKLKNLFYW